MSCADWIIHDGGADRTLVFLPGWATDGRILAGVEIGYNTIVPVIGSSAASLEGEAPPSRPDQPLYGGLSGAGAPGGSAGPRPPGTLVSLLQGRAPVILCGWSLGGFAAVAFAREHPELVSKLVLVGVRRRYPAEQVAARRQALREDRRRCLTDFYRQCFLPAQREEFRRFRAGLEPAYLREFPADMLEAGLDYLAAAELSGEALPDCPTVLVHGERDIVAPLDEARALAEEGRCALHVLPAGHAAFLAPEFTKILHDESHNQQN